MGSMKRAVWTESPFILTFRHVQGFKAHRQCLLLRNIRRNKSTCSLINELPKSDLSLKLAAIVKPPIASMARDGGDVYPAANYTVSLQQLGSRTPATECPCRSVFIKWASLRNSLDHLVKSLRTAGERAKHNKNSPMGNQDANTPSSTPTQANARALLKECRAMISHDIELLLPKICCTFRSSMAMHE